jgi:plasmid maintenance system antidote protein VapI
MFIAQEIVDEVIHELCKEAVKKAGTQNKLAFLIGVNAGTITRSINKKEGLSARALLSLYLFIGFEKSQKIIEDVTKELIDKYSTVEGYFQHLERMTRKNYLSNP